MNSIKKIVKNSFDLLITIINCIALMIMIFVPFLNKYINEKWAIALWVLSFFLTTLYSCKKEKPQIKNEVVESLDFLSKNMGVVWILILGSAFVINYFSTWYNVKWAIALCAFVCIPITINNIFNYQLKKNKIDKDLSIKNKAKYILFYMIIDAFYVAFFNGNLKLQLILGTLSLTIILSGVVSAFLSEKFEHKVLIIHDFIIAVVLTIYLIYIIPNADIRQITLTIVSSIYGAFIALTGVAWTLKKNEFGKREEERKANIPYLRISNAVNCGEIIKTSAPIGNQFSNEEIFATKEKTLYGYRLNDFIIENIANANIIIKSININDTVYKINNNYMIPKSQKAKIEFNKWIVNSLSSAEKIFIEVEDILQNKYRIQCNYDIDYKSFQIENDSSLVNALEEEITICSLSLPEKI